MHPAVKNARKAFIDALDEYVDSRHAYLDSCSQVTALEYRTSRPDVMVIDADEAMEKLREVRHQKEKAFKEKRHTLGQRLDKILVG